MNLSSIEKDKQPSQEILRLFEKTRVAYLSAKTDPSEYGGRWRNMVDTIRESYNEIDAASKELKETINETLLDDKEIKNPASEQAKELFEAIKLIRYSSHLVDDPFAKRFTGGIIK